MRDAEIKSLSWTQINFAKKYLTVGRAKTEGGEGRTIPLNSDLFSVLMDYVEWYQHKFGSIQQECYVFPFGSPQPTDPTRHVTTLKTVWNNIREKAGIKGRWHDNRHTLVTELAESGAGDQTIMDIAGHVSKQMLKHYSHIRMEAKRTALESILRLPNESPEPQTSTPKQHPNQPRQMSESVGQTPMIEQRSARTKNSRDLVNFEGNCSELPATTRGFEGVSLQNPLQSTVLEGHRGVYRKRKSKKITGSSGRTRTYNPSVNS
jgi:hypothetical protein